MIRKFVLLFSFVMIFILLAGCTTQSNSATPANTSPNLITTTVTPNMVSSIPTTPSTNFTPNVIASSPTPEKKGFTNDDINKHFIAIIGNDYTRIYKESGSIRMQLSGQSSKEDINTVLDFNKEFNSLTPDVTLPEVEYGLKGTGFQISFLPETSLSEITPKSIKKTVKKDGQIKYLLGSNSYQIYFNSDLTGDERKHYLIRSILEMLDLNGDDYQYSDSIFNPDAILVTNMSSLDKAAIKVLYSKRILNGMTPDQVKTALLL